jgi:hypothetical protein
MQPRLKGFDGLTARLLLDYSRIRSLALLLKRRSSIHTIKRTTTLRRLKDENAKEDETRNLHAIGGCLPSHMIRIVYLYSHRALTRTLVRSSVLLLRLKWSMTEYRLSPTTKDLLRAFLGVSVLTWLLVVLHRKASLIPEQSGGRSTTLLDNDRLLAGAR